MSYPENPETIILKNRFYPKGLKEIDIWNYYQKVRSLVVKNTSNRDLMLAIITYINNPILRRKGKSGVIKLNESNYNDVITGRTITIYSTMDRVETFGIIDIDVDEWKWGRIAAMDVYSYIMDSAPVIRTAEIRYTGKGGFHIICNFKSPMRIESIKFLLQKILQSSQLSNKYTIEQKRRPNIPNLDLSLNKFKGAYITEGSLSILGLKCMRVDYNDLLRFEPHRAKI